MSVAVVLGFFVNVIINAPENSLKAFNPNEAPSYTGILFGVLYGVLIFVGFETAANLAEEAEEPKRAIPKAVMLSISLVAVFYVIAAYAQVAGFGFDLAVLTSPEVAAAPLFALGSPDAAGGYGGSSDLMLKVLLVVVLLDVMAVGLGAATASTRGLFALARDRKIPGLLASTTKGGNPITAALVVLVVSAAWVLATYGVEDLLALEGVPHELAVFQWISTLGAFMIMVVYGVMALGAFSGLRDHPNKAAARDLRPARYRRGRRSALRRDLQGGAAVRPRLGLGCHLGGARSGRDARREGARAGSPSARGPLDGRGGLRGREPQG